MHTPCCPSQSTSIIVLTKIQSIAAVGNWIFNFALGLFVPPGFANITWKMFIVFGVLCVGAAIQVFFTYVHLDSFPLEQY